MAIRIFKSVGGIALRGDFFTYLKRVLGLLIL